MKTKTKRTKAIAKQPLTASLPDFVKDPANYQAIEKKLKMTMLSDHTHTTVKQFVKCARCTTKRAKRDAIMKEYGFESAAQFYEWRRIMDIIINKKNV